MAPKFASRKVKKGKVHFNRHTYVPEEIFRSYDGRLDNMTFVFADYPGNPDYICLWGTEEEFAQIDEPAELTGPYIVNGTLLWLFWKRLPNGNG